MPGGTVFRGRIRRNLAARVGCIFGHVFNALGKVLGKILGTSPRLCLASFKVFPQRRAQPLVPAAFLAVWGGFFAVHFVIRQAGRDACARVPLMARIAALRADFFGISEPAPAAVAQW